MRLAAARALAGREGSLDEAARRRLEETLDELIRSRMLTADLPATRLDLGQLYEARGDPGRAEAEYRAAIALEPGFAPSYVTLATLLEAGGRSADALATLERGVERAGDDPTLHYALGLAHARAEPSRLALAHLGSAARSSPERSDLAVAHAVALNGAGRRGAARVALEEVLRTRPWDADARFLLATILRDGGDRVAALRHAEALAGYWPGCRAIGVLVAELGSTTLADR
ncbi:MAG: tetratricopeptide repeat protein [Gemmatimonadales bacterium]